jgi:hypothetical protein
LQGRDARAQDLHALDSQGFIIDDQGAHEALSTVMGEPALVRMGKVNTLA